MTSPSPRPPVSRLLDASSRTNGSNTRSRSACAIPGPSSSTTMRSSASSRSIRTVARSPWPAAFSSRLRRAAGRRAATIRSESSTVISQLGSERSAATLSRSTWRSTGRAPSRRTFSRMNASESSVMRCISSSAATIFARGLPVLDELDMQPRARDWGPGIVRDRGQHDRTVADVAVEPCTHEVERAHRVARLHRPHLGQVAHRLAPAEAAHRLRDPPRRRDRQRLPRSAERLGYPGIFDSKPLRRPARSGEAYRLAGHLRASVRPIRGGFRVRGSYRQRRRRALKSGNLQQV